MIPTTILIMTLGCWALQLSTRKEIILVSITLLQKDIWLQLRIWWQQETRSLCGRERRWEWGGIRGLWGLNVRRGICIWQIVKDWLKGIGRLVWLGGSILVICGNWCLCDIKFNSICFLIEILCINVLNNALIYSLLLRVIIHLIFVYLQFIIFIR